MIFCFAGNEADAGLRTAENVGVPSESFRDAGCARQSGGSGGGAACFARRTLRNFSALGAEGGRRHAPMRWDS
nr:hypothetical protein [Bacillota bacterium]